MYAEKHTKKLIGVWACMLCAAALLALPTAAQDEPVLAVAGQTVSAGQTASIAVTLSGSGYIAYQMELYYDVALAEAVAVAGGPGGTPQWNAAEPGKISLAYAGATEQAAGVLFTVEFQVSDAWGVGQSMPLCLKNVRVFGADGRDLVLTVTDGFLADSRAPEATASSGPIATGRTTSATSATAASGTTPAAPRSTAYAASPSTVSSAPSAALPAASGTASAATAAEAAVAGDTKSSAAASDATASAEPFPAGPVVCIAAGAVGLLLLALLWNGRRQKRSAP